MKRWDNLNLKFYRFLEDKNTATYEEIKKAFPKHYQIFTNKANRGHPDSEIEVKYSSEFKCYSLGPKGKKELQRIEHILLLERQSNTNKILAIATIFIGIPTLCSLIETGIIRIFGAILLIIFSTILLLILGKKGIL